MNYYSLWHRQKCKCPFCVVHRSFDAVSTLVETCIFFVLIAPLVLYLLLDDTLGWDEASVQRMEKVTSDLQKAKKEEKIDE